MENFINYINGRWEETVQSNIPIYDAGFLLGDGLFETIRFDKNKIFSLDKHINRLLIGLDAIRIKLNINKNEIKEILNNIIYHNSLDSGLLRLMVTRGIIEGPPWQHDGPPAIYVTIRRLSLVESKPVKVEFYSENKYPIIRFNPAMKSLNYIGNMLAKQDADRDGAYEPVFYNKDGIITECAIRNIFFIKDNILYTPSLSLGVLPGVMRETIISIGTKLNLQVKESKIKFSDINKMEEAFISSTGIGLLPCYWSNWISHYNLTYEIKKYLNTIIYKGNK